MAKSKRLQALNKRLRKAGYQPRWVPITSYSKDKSKIMKMVRNLNANNPMREYRTGGNWDKSKWAVEKKEWF